MVVNVWIGKQATHHAETYINNTPLSLSLNCAVLLLPVCCHNCRLYLTGTFLLLSNSNVESCTRNRATEWKNWYTNEALNHALQPYTIWQYMHTYMYMCTYMYMYTYMYMCMHASKLIILYMYTYVPLWVLFRELSWMLLSTWPCGGFAFSWRLCDI